MDSRGPVEGRVEFGEPSRIAGWEAGKGDGVVALPIEATRDRFVGRDSDEH
jgi:hypothetical protein